MQIASPKVLLVLDDPTLGAITAFRLELLGYRVECVASGEAVLEAVERESPGLIVVDLLLSGSEGFQLVDRLSNDERSAGVPVLGLSSNADLEAVHRAFAAGVKDYLVVPYDPAVLEQKLEHWLPLEA